MPFKDGPQTDIPHADKTLPLYNIIPMLHEISMGNILALRNLLNITTIQQSDKVFQLPQVLVAPNMISKSPHFRVADVRGSPSREEPCLRNSYKSLVMFAFSARPGIFESPRNPDFPKF